jgi:hypothetical protein
MKPNRWLDGSFSFESIYWFVLLVWTPLATVFNGSKLFRICNEFQKRV